MPDSDSLIFTWIILPFLIFIARVLDVSLGTVRVIFVSKGLKYLAPVVGFFEVFIWIMVIGQIMKNLDNFACYFAYAGGFATGNFVGMLIAEKLSLGIVLLRIITSKEADELIKSLSSANYGVTSVDGRGSQGKVKIIFTIMQRREVGKAIELVKKFNPNAFYTVGDVDFVEKGVFPAKPNWRSIVKTFYPFRKGK